MKYLLNLIIGFCFFVLPTAYLVGQSQSVNIQGRGIGEIQDDYLRGTINNYVQQSLFLYKCYGDTLLLIDSNRTDSKGTFTFPMPPTNFQSIIGLYKLVLQQNQYFYILYEEAPIEIQTAYLPDYFNNIATDSLKVIQSQGLSREKESANEQFYEFQHLQKQLNIANYFLMEIMRLYPLTDPFHKQMENEYLARYDAMERFVEKYMKNTSSVAKIALAYYIPFNPDWKQPDCWRDSIIADHYFDYFNPADSIFLHTNILPEKMEMYLAMCTNKRDAYGQTIYDEQLFSESATEFINKTISNEETFLFCLNYFLKKFNKEHKEKAFLSLYDTYLIAQELDCGSIETNEFSWARKKADKLRNVQINSIAPDFQLMDGRLNLHGLQTDYTLLFFWASWCPYCVAEIPKLKELTDKFTSQQLMTVAISLDNSKTDWQEVVLKYQLFKWLNYSELNGWNGDVVKQYNVYATPTLILLDNNKKIIAKPLTIKELDSFLYK